MSIRKRRHNIAKGLLMAIVIVVNLRQVPGNVADKVELDDGASRFPMMRRYKTERRGLIEWDPNSQDNHDPTKLFDELNQDTRLNKEAKYAHQEYKNSDLMPQSDYTKSLKFKNAVKQNTADLLQAKKAKDNLRYWLNITSGKVAKPEADIESGEDQEDNATFKKYDQQDRQRDQNAASDRAFERLINQEKERIEGVEIRPFKDEPRTEAKPNLLAKTQTSSQKPKLPTTTKAASIETQPRTESPLVCLPEPTPYSPTKSPPKDKNKSSKEKKKPQQIYDSVISADLLKTIQDMKKHALLVLRTLNYLELEILNRSPSSCQSHESAQQNRPPEKNKERLDAPSTTPSSSLLPKHHQLQGFHFGIRPADDQDTQTVIDAARKEELKLAQKVRAEYYQQLQQLKDADWLPMQQVKRFREAAPPAAARLEPVYPKTSDLNLKALAIVPLDTSSAPEEASVEEAQLDVRRRKNKKRKKKKHEVLARVILSQERLAPVEREQMLWEQLKQTQINGARRQPSNQQVNLH